MKINIKSLMSMVILLASQAVVPVAKQIQEDAYINQIVSIQEVHGATKYTLVLTFEKSGPIITYAPADFQESQSESVYRMFLPNTTIFQGLVNAMPEAIKEVGLGVELLLFGTMLSKNISDKQIVISLKVA